MASAYHYRQISSEAFNTMQFGAGVITDSFDFSNMEEPYTQDNILCTTSGGVNDVLARETIDLGEDVDNCPNDTKELLRTESVTCTIGFTALDYKKKFLKIVIGSTAEDSLTGEISVNKTLHSLDFKKIYHILEINGGGLAVVVLENAFSTGGLSSQTTKNEKGKLTCEFRGFTSLSDPDNVPMKFYVFDAPYETTTETFTGDSTTTSFTLAHTPVEITSATIDGTATTAYTISGTAIEFNSAPENDAAISVTYKY